MLSCLQMAQELERAAIKAKNEIEVPTEALMKLLAEEAKGFLGHYQEGWAPLKPATIARKAKGDTPLLESGEMRETIKGEAELRPYGAEGVVGSESKIALYQEMGTVKIPPRPFLALAMSHCYEKADVAFGKFALALLR